MRITPDTARLSVKTGEAAPQSHDPALPPPGDGTTPPPVPVAGEQPTSPLAVQPAFSSTPAEVAHPAEGESTEPPPTPAD